MKRLQYAALTMILGLTLIGSSPPAWSQDPIEFSDVVIFATHSAYLGSNHNVIADSQGNWVSMLHTGHGGAPGIFIDGVRATSFLGGQSWAEVISLGMNWELAFITPSSRAS